MTDPTLTRLVIIADRSGSMRPIQDDMNGGIRQLLAEQAAIPGVVVDVVTFDHEVEYPFTGVRPDDIKTDIIQARGRTALNDAVGLTISKLGAELSSLAEDDRPGHVIMVVVTDGHENASQEYTTEQVRQMVTMQTDQYGWVFLYLAANVDAFATGAAFGYAPGQTLSYAPTSKGAAGAFATASSGITRSRLDQDADFTDAERQAAK